MRLRPIGLCLAKTWAAAGAGESVWALNRRIGWVAPELHLQFPESETCLDTAVSGFDGTAGAFWLPTPPQRAMARRWLTRFGLTASANRSFGWLSVGLQRMVLLARALSPGARALKNPGFPSLFGE